MDSRWRAREERWRPGGRELKQPTLQKHSGNEGINGQTGRVTDRLMVFLLLERQMVLVPGGWLTGGGQTPTLAGSSWRDAAHRGDLGSVQSWCP